MSGPDYLNCTDPVHYGNFEVLAACNQEILLLMSDPVLVISYKQ